MTIESITIRQAGVDDIPALVRLRRTMFESMGYDDPARLAATDQAAREYFAAAIPIGVFYGWLATTAAGQAVASGGAVIDRHPPGPTNLSGQSGYIMNISTDPRYRLRRPLSAGIARRMMQTILHWMAEQDIQQVTLHATEVGRPLYEQLGFVESNEMHLAPDAQGPHT